MEAYSWVLEHPFPNPPAAKFASQGGAHVRNAAQIKFLYYSLVIYVGNSRMTTKLKG